MIGGSNVAIERGKVLSHHSNSRRFKCPCGIVHKRWDESDVILCGCGRTHVRSAAGGTALSAAKERAR